MIDLILSDDGISPMLLDETILLDQLCAQSELNLFGSIICSKGRMHICLVQIIKIKNKFNQYSKISLFVDIALIYMNYYFYKKL